MMTAAKAAANRRNARLSTGPRTAEGRAVARMNALAHGLRAASPVVPGEDPEAWEAFRDAVVGDLAPAGVLEGEFAERVALLSWRLRRVAIYEAGIVARAADQAARRVRGEGDGEVAGPQFGAHAIRRTLTVVRQEIGSARQAAESSAETLHLLDMLTDTGSNAGLPGEDALVLLRELAHCAAPPPVRDDDFDLDLDEEDSDERFDPRHTDVDDARFLRAVGVPDEFLRDPTSWDGWTGAVVQTGAYLIAELAGEAAAALLARCRREAIAALADDRAKLSVLRVELRDVERRTVVEEAEARRRALVPAAESAEVVVRYEGHLQRQLLQTLHQLERMRAARSAFPPLPPVVVDVTVDGQVDGERRPIQPPSHMS